MPARCVKYVVTGAVITRVLSRPFSGRVTVIVAGALFVLAVACGSDDAPGAAPTAVPVQEQEPTVAATASPSPAATPSQASSPTATSEPPPTPSSTVAPPTLPRPPDVDTDTHSVPLRDIIFDTFDGRFVRLPDATPNTVDRLRDRIRPIYQPRYEGFEGGRWLDGSDLVIGYVGEREAFAYPIKMLNLHELVNDVIDGVPLLVSYCPLCASGVVYDRRMGDGVLLFGNTSALYQNDLVMFDHATGSYWFQVGGEAIVGKLTGEKLKLLPSATATWDEWLALHPQTRVLSRDQGFDRRYSYDRDPFAGGGYERRLDEFNFPFPVNTEKLDTRLRASEVMLSVQADGDEKAYALGQLGNAAVNDTVGGEPIVVVSRASGAVGSAFSRIAAGRTLTFRLAGNRLKDDETGTFWELSGTAVEGELAGEQLELLPTRRAFWFSLSLAVPGIEIYEAA